MLGDEAFAGGSLFESRGGILRFQTLLAFRSLVSVFVDIVILVGPTGREIVGIHEVSVFFIFALGLTAFDGGVFLLLKT